MTTPCHVLMICGSLRTGSTNEAALRTAAAVAPGGVTTTLFDRLSELPHFNPDDDREPLHPTVAELRQGIGAADALLFCTPEYAGTLPGTLKNLLDWTIGGGEVNGTPAGWVNSSVAPTGAAGAYATLRSVLGYAGADLVEAACAHIPVPRDALGPDGLITESALRTEIAGVLTALSDHVAGKRTHQD
ncbi:MAG TPA: NAD(P)H-dependent oxidoreductase [Mycobacteriales bacterium]|nr:NAD(P)H-dependent oxidoreductase [Mycobacteriales bacterium]